MERRAENTELSDGINHSESNLEQQLGSQDNVESNITTKLASDDTANSLQKPHEIPQEIVLHKCMHLLLVEDLDRENNSLGPDVDIIHVTRNLLPSELLLPNSKILGNEIVTRRRHFRFSFDVADVLASDFTLQSLENQAFNLLSCLARVYKEDTHTSEDESRGPAIIFVAYDLGALIVKQALAFAAQDIYQWLDISTRSASVIFWGCPHRGASRYMLESDLFRLIQILKDEANLSYVPPINAIRWLADSIIFTTGIFLHSKVTLNCRVVSVYGNKNGSGNIPQVFDKFSATLGDPLETVVEELDKANTDWPSSSFAQKLCLRASNWAPLAKWIPIEQTLNALATPPRQSTICTTYTSTDVLDAKEHREWVEGSGHQLLYVHGQTRQAVIEAAEQIVSSYRLGTWNKGASGTGYFSFAFSSYDPSRSSITSMITTYLAQLVSDERSEEGYKWLSDQFNIQNGWTREDLFGLLSTRWWFDFNGQVATVFLQDFDECDKNDRLRFLNLWNKMAKSNETILKLVVTSRKRGTLLAELQGWPTLEVDKMNSRTHDNTDGNIQTSALENRLKSLCRHCYREADRFKIQEYVRTLSSSSNGSTTLDSILDLIQDHSGWPAEPSEASLEHFIRLLDRMPLGLTVESALDIILQSNDKKSGVQRAIAWILHSWRPLSAWELATIMCLYTYRDSERDIVDFKPAAQIHALAKIRTWFRGMLNESHGQIRFKSKIRHLMCPDNATETNYIWNKIKQRNAQSMIFNFCLEYLAKTSVFQRLVSQNENYISRIMALKGAIVPPLVPDGKDLMFYVVQCLPYYLSQRQYVKPREIYRLLRRLGDRLDVWARVWWAMSNPFSRSSECPTSAEALLIQLGLIRPRGQKLSKCLDLVLIGAVTSGQCARVDEVLKNNVLANAVLMHALSTAVKIGTENIAISIAKKILPHQGQGEDGHNGENDCVEAAKVVVKWPHTMIWRAAWLGLDRLANLLLDTGADANGGGVAPQLLPSPLFVACRAGHRSMVTQLLLHGARTDANIASTECILHAAATYGYHPEIIDALVGRDKSGLLEYNKPDTPLYQAARNGNWQAVTMLLQHGADPQAGIMETSDHAHSWSPLCTASSACLIKTMKALVEGGADLNTCAPWGQDTPLWFAAVATASVEGCQVLLNAGANPNHKLFHPPLIVELMKSSFNSTEAILKVSSVLLHHKQPIWLDDPDTTNGQTALMYAAKRHEPGSSLVSWLLRNGAEINTIDSSGKRAIFHAVQADNVAVVKELLSLDLLDLKVKSETSPRTVLEAALIANTSNSSVNCELVDMLIMAGADIEVDVDNGARILNLAVQKGNIKVVQTLLAQNAKLDHRDRLGWMPIHDAVAYSSDAKIVRLLAEAGASLRDVLEISGRGVLHLAMPEEPDILIVLLQFRRELNLEQRDFEGNTPLLTPGIRLECARLMIRAGADVNARDAKGNTLLVKAVHAHDTELIDLLMSESHIEIGSALHVACEAGHVDLATKLLDRATNVEVNQQLPIRHSTPLLAAIIPQNLPLGHRDPENTQRIVRALIDKGADVGDAVSVSHSTVFYSAIAAAAFSGPVECIDLLLDKGMPEQPVDPLGRLPIHFAAAGGVQNLQTVTFMGRKGADMVKDISGKTCLHWAAQNGRVRAIEAILKKFDYNERRKHVNEPDIDGWTPLCWAVRTCYEPRIRNTTKELDPADHIGTIKYLITHGADCSVECSIQKGLDVEAETFTLYKLAYLYKAESEIVDLIRPSLDQEETDTRPYKLGLKVCSICFCYTDGPVFSCDVCIDFWVCNKCYGRISLYHGHFKTEESQTHTFSSSPEGEEDVDDDSDGDDSVSDDDDDDESVGDYIIED
ncbi:ankyrin repeat-containing domain protein [Nemania sp. FL0031]|nr:ankyrin repeat-containing domain protein [Nemania sp. FL0031]